MNDVLDEFMIDAELFGHYGEVTELYDVALQVFQSGYDCRRGEHVLGGELQVLFSSNGPILEKVEGLGVDMGQFHREVPILVCLRHVFCIESVLQERAPWHPLLLLECYVGSVVQEQGKWHRRLLSFFSDENGDRRTFSQPVRLHISAHAYIGYWCSELMFGELTAFALVLF